MSRKTKDTGEVDSDGEPVQLSDVEKEGDGGIGDEGSKEARMVQPKQAGEATVEDGMVEEKPAKKPRKGRKSKEAKGLDAKGAAMEAPVPEANGSVPETPAPETAEVKTEADDMKAKGPAKKGRKSKTK